MSKFLNWLAGELWGWPMMILIFLCGLIFGLGTGFFQIRKLPYVLRETLGKCFKKDKLEGEGTITPLQAVSSALAGCIGNGNIAGVATAIATGGPGAVFWMWIMGLFGMMTKFVEVVLAVHFREQTESGAFYGGPMYYIEKGMGKRWKPLAMFYGVMMIVGALGTAVWVQPHTMASALKSTFGIPPWPPSSAPSFLPRSYASAVSNASGVSPKVSCLTLSSSIPYFRSGLFLRTLRDCPKWSA